MDIGTKVEVVQKYTPNIKGIIASDKIKLQDKQVIMETKIQKLEKELALKELEVKTLTRELISFQHEYYKD